MRPMRLSTTFNFNFKYSIKLHLPGLTIKMFITFTCHCDYFYYNNLKNYSINNCLNEAYHTASFQRIFLAYSPFYSVETAGERKSFRREKLTPRKNFPDFIAIHDGNEKFPPPPPLLFCSSRTFNVLLGGGRRAG